MQTWWTLPGNRRFLDDLADALSEGQSAIVNLSALAPSGIETALELLLADRDYRLRRVSLPDEVPAKPCSWLYENLIHDLPVEKARDIHSLGAEPELAGYVVLLSSRDGADTSVWMSWVNQAQAALRLRSKWERPFFILITRHQLPSRLPAPDSGLVVRHYVPSPQRHELRYLCSSFLSATAGLNLLQELHLEVVIHLGMWDAALCQELSRLPLNDLLKPISLLRSWADDLGWSNAAADASLENRLSGRTGTFTGCIMQHSALAAKRGDHREINRRLWKAQVAVIFPHIEEQRAAWVEKTRHLLRPPFQTGQVTRVSSAEDLEIGQLHYFLKLCGRLPHVDLQEIRRLKEARHQLAHLEVMDTSSLESLLGTKG